MPTPRRCSAPPSTAPSSPPRALPTWPRRGNGQPRSCTGTTTNTATAASATSPRPNAMPAKTGPSSLPATPCTGRPASAIRAAGAGAPATGRRSAPSPSTRSATAWWPWPLRPCFPVRLADLLSRPDLASSPPRAPWQPHQPSGGPAHHEQDRRPRYEASATTALTRTGRVAPVRLHPVARLARDERGRDDRAGMAEGDDQSVQPVPRRTGLVAEVQPVVLRRQPRHEPPHALRRGVELAEIADLPVPSLVGHGHRVAQLRRVDPDERLSRTRHRRPPDQRTERTQDGSPPPLDRPVLLRRRTCGLTIL